MKTLMSVAAAAALVTVFSFVSLSEAEASCEAGYDCAGAVLVPAPQPIPLRRWRRARIIVAPPCIAPCGVDTPAAPVAAAPCIEPCGPPPRRRFFYRPRNYYSYYTQPAYAETCTSGPGNCFSVNSCWYDSFGRRFCN